ncbi:hypothetical protein BV22DRAFT_1134262 [Leucogyrophana mollusca]|uniref:Uncharacterized protein n=1 Tax=Leucogyrophana mollusca TaxID=85980 RepID=A0ACB8AZN1_9AGAM|nr:hypothetical protein BV22DRAFT_1134262 [Leucogyrophana mollusca]
MAVFPRWGTSSPAWYHSTARKDLGVGPAPEETDRSAELRDSIRESNAANAKKASHKESVLGSYVLWITVFRKLRPIAQLPEKEFLRAWWGIALCHYDLWKGGIHHRDISESNLMYYHDTQGIAVGVLNDYDLSSTIEGCQGNERAGTLPFMAIGLLDKEGLEGHIIHQYRHDAESLVWVLTWVTLHYSGGTRLPRKDRPLEVWLSLQAAACGNEKWNMTRRGHAIVPPPSQKMNWEVARRCLKVLAAHYLELDGEPVMKAVEEVFEKWLYNLVKDFLD